MHLPRTTLKGRIRLADFDPADTGGMEKDDARKAARKWTREIGELQRLLYANSTHALLLVFQGFDASGKDGAIRKVLRYVNPAGVQTASFKVPTLEEQAHDFLWRVHRAVPRYGHIGVFNRSHYEAVLAERVIHQLSPAECRRRFDQIIEFEEMLAEHRVVVLKFFLHLSRAEQAERFRKRLTRPEKRWKFALGDLENRRRWKEYTRAADEMLSATSHPAARWHLVPADRKWFRDYVVAAAVVAALRALKLKWPEPKEDLSNVRIV